MLLIFFQMRIQQLLIALARQRLERTVVLLIGISADIMIVHEVGSSHDIERRCCGIAHLHTLGLVLHLSVSQHLHAQLGGQFTVYSLLSHILNHRGQLVLLYGMCCLQRTLTIHGKREGTLLVGFQMHNDGIVGLRGKDRSLVANPINGISGGVQRFPQTQLSAIVFGGFLTRIVKR